MYFYEIMKIYEKPMAIIEKIEVEDVITASNITLTADERTALAGQVDGAQDVILF